MADPNIRRKDLPGGLRVFSEPLAEATSVALGLWIRAGSRDEMDEVAGISHLMEHMLFKGTPDMDALGIAQAFEGIGAQENAATGEEYTVLYARFLPEHMGRALDIMSDMVLRPTLVDLEREREVIVEEIKMYEDRPDQLADEYLSSLIFHKTPRPPDHRVGPDGPRGSTTNPQDFNSDTYTAPNIFVGRPPASSTRTTSNGWSRRSFRLPAGRAFVREEADTTRESRFSGSRRRSNTTYRWALWEFRRRAKTLCDGALNNILGGA